jgi:hypothetical protein
MYWHVPTGLRGPVSRTRRAWKLHPTAPVRRPRRRSTTPFSDVRHGLVARVRQELSEGRYDTPQRWEAALEALFSRLEFE